MAENLSPLTGYWGIWNERTKTFILGIQEKTKYHANKTVAMKVSTKTLYRSPHWRAKKIRESHAHMFHKPLKYKKGAVNDG